MADVIGRKSAASLAILSFGFVACSVYDESLLSSGMSSSTSSNASAGSGGTGGMGTGGTAAVGPGSTSTGGGSSGCSAAADCPGQDGECQTITCDGGVCGVSNAAAGTMLAAQTAGDCLLAVCDGQGGITSMNDDADVPDDGKVCTVDACASGASKHTPKAAGSPCSEGGGKVCSALGACVECAHAADCASVACDTQTGKCIDAGCSDGVKNGSETDIDCGGSCAACAFGKICGSNIDCVSQLCKAMTCAESCFDGVQNNGESDVDCGGANCAPCAAGKTCVTGTDCATSTCAAGTCSCGDGHLVISEVRTRGAAGAFDEFVELYNPTSCDVALDTTWILDVRSNSVASYTKRWTGAVGQMVPAHGHFLIVGPSYAQMPAKDASLSSGITDAASLVLKQNLMTIDAVCFGYNMATLAVFTAVGSTYVCEGTPVSNLPHNDTTNGSSNADASLDRKPGGGSGNGTDSGDSAKDFQPLTPASPQSSASAPTP